MSDTTPRLSLPMIRPAQAQKHITHNEALIRLDALVQLRISGFDMITPPASPGDGEVFALGTGAEDDWAGADGKLALRIGTGWEFITPQDGWLGWGLGDDSLRVWGDGGWQRVQMPTDNLASLGVGTSADSTNRLSVAAPASLFTHAGAGHQLKVNKASSADTASLLFQSNWTGHAEMGLAGDTGFHLKLSADGGTWVTALRADAASVRIDLPVSGPAVQQAPEDITAGRLMRADWGYGPGNLVGTVAMNGPVPGGAVIEQGTTSDGRYTRWADGTQICWTTLSIAYADAGRLEQLWSYPAAFATPPAVTATLSDETTTSLAPGALTGPFAPGPQSTQVTLRLYASEGSAGFVSGDTASLGVMAIGRWI